jgi:hypothetical protein
MIFCVANRIRQGGMSNDFSKSESCLVARNRCTLGVTLCAQTLNGRVCNVHRGPIKMAQPSRRDRQTDQSGDQDRVAGKGPIRAAILSSSNVMPGAYVLRVDARASRRRKCPAFNVGVSQTTTQNVALIGGLRSAKRWKWPPMLKLFAKLFVRIGTVITEKVVEDLPLNGQELHAALTLTPGVTPLSTSQNSKRRLLRRHRGIPGSGFSDASFTGS